MASSSTKIQVVTVRVERTAEFALPPGVTLTEEGENGGGPGSWFVEIDDNEKPVLVYKDQDNAEYRVFLRHEDYGAAGANWELDGFAEEGSEEEEESDSDVLPEVPGHGATIYRLAQNVLHLVSSDNRHDTAAMEAKRLTTVTGQMHIVVRDGNPVPVGMTMACALK